MLNFPNFFFCVTNYSFGPIFYTRSRWTFLQLMIITLTSLEKHRDTAEDWQFLLRATQNLTMKRNDYIFIIDLLLLMYRLDIKCEVYKMGVGFGLVIFVLYLNDLKAILKQKLLAICYQTQSAKHSPLFPCFQIDNQAIWLDYLSSQCSSGRQISPSLLLILCAGSKGMTILGS